MRGPWDLETAWGLGDSGGIPGPHGPRGCAVSVQGRPPALGEQAGIAGRASGDLSGRGGFRRPGPRFPGWLRLLVAVVTAALLGGTAWLAAGRGYLHAENTPRPSDSTRGTAEEEKGYGWGYQKSRGGVPPSIPLEWRRLLEKYGAHYLGDTRTPRVALTFNMGFEEPGHTPALLASLARNGVRSAFFVTGHWLKTSPDLARRVVAEGHRLGNHGWSHRSLPGLPSEEVLREFELWDGLALQTVGARPRLFRPPSGEFSGRVLRLAREHGYVTVFWSIAIVDWVPMPHPGAAVSGVAGQLHNGAVIQLHGTSRDVVSKLDEIIGTIRERGFEIVPLEELLPLEYLP